MHPHRSGEQHKRYSENKGVEGDPDVRRARLRRRRKGDAAVGDAGEFSHVEFPVQVKDSHSSLRCTSWFGNNIARWVQKASTCANAILMVLSGKHQKVSGKIGTGRRGGAGRRRRQ